MVVHGEAAAEALLTSPTKPRGSIAKQLSEVGGKENEGKMKEKWCPATTQGRWCKKRAGLRVGMIKETKISVRGKSCTASAL